MALAELYYVGGFTIPLVQETEVNSPVYLVYDNGLLSAWAATSQQVYLGAYKSYTLEQNFVKHIAICKVSGGYVNRTYHYEDGGTVHYEWDWNPTVNPINRQYGDWYYWVEANETESIRATQGYSIYQTLSLTEALDQLINEVEHSQPDDPFAEGGTSEPGGGGGAQDNTSDTITDSPLPTLSVADTGFTTIYNPTLAQLRSLASYMWTDDTFLETLINHAKQLLENPINSIIALNILPCQVADAGAQEVRVLYIPTGVTMNKAANQFTDVDCGSVTLENYYNSAMDYSPFTRVSCYLPYIGQVTLNTDEVMGKTLSITYRVDIVTGMCVAKIFVDGSVLYQFSGHCAVNMPVTSADFSYYVGAVIQAAKMTAGVVAAAAGAPAVAAGLIGGPAPQSSTSKTVTTTRNPKTGRQITTGTETVTRETTPASFGETVAKAASNTVDAVMGSKMIVDHSGGFSGNSGYLGIRRPYLIIERPRMCNPAEYGKYNGYPSMLFLNLGSCSGYTEVQSIQLTGIRATNPELSELSMLLKSGVIL